MNEDFVNPIDAKMQLYALNRIEPGKDASNSPTGVTDVGGDPYAWRDFSGSGCSLFPLGDEYPVREKETTRDSRQSTQHIANTFEGQRVQV